MKINLDNSMKKLYTYNSKKGGIYGVGKIHYDKKEF